MVDSLINQLMIVLSIWLLFSISINYECMRLPRSGLHVFPVDTCPTNLSEVQAASRRLNCSGIQEFEYVYHCLPRFDLSHLVEFCYDDISGWTEPGNCMVLHTHTLNNHPCKYFTKDCPNKPYLIKEMYNYPACIDIDRKEKCYRMDPSCTSITRKTTEEEPGGRGWIAAVVTPVVVLCLVVLIIIIIIHVVRRRRVSTSRQNTKRYETNRKESTPLILDSNKPTNTDKDELEGSGKSHDNHHGLKSYILLDWTEDDEFFVTTEASKAVENKIEKQNFIIVVGNSGSGKSSIIQHIALKYKQQGWDVIPVDDIKEIKDACATDLSKKMFVFHDPVGKESLSDIPYENWKRYENTLKTCLKEVKILLSCRLCVFHDERLKGIMKETNNSIRIDDGALKLSRDEKRKILHQYTRTESTQLEKDETEEIIEADAYFPLLCKLFFSESRYKERGVNFFKNPYEVVKEEIEIYKNSKDDNEKSKYCALIFLVVFNNIVNVDDLDEYLTSDFQTEKYKDILKMSDLSYNTPITSVTKGFELLEGSFVRRVGNSYKFVHDFVQEITTVVVGTKFPKQTIKYADSGFLRRRVKIEDGKQEHDPFTVYLPDRYIDDLVQRFICDIQTDRLLDVVLNPCLRDKRVIASFTKRLEKENDISLDVKLKFVEVDERELEKVEKNNMMSRVHFFLTQDEVTPISALIIFCHDEIAIFCLNNFTLCDGFLTLASICTNGNTALYEAYSEKYAVEFSDVIWGGFYAIHITSLFHNLKMIQRLIRHTENINMLDNHGLTSLICAVMNEDKPGSSTVRDSLPTIKFLLVKGADPNLCHIGNGPLHTACANGHDNTVQLLLNNGADINLCDNDGDSPLYFACQNGHDNTVQLLLNNGADVNLCKKNRVSPLYIACQNGHDNTVELLLKNSVNINLVTNEGASPLHVTCFNGHDSIVQMLLNTGADINLCDKNGVSPLFLACCKEHERTVQLLLNNDADINLCKNDAFNLLFITSCIGQERKEVNEKIPYPQSSFY